MTKENIQIGDKMKDGTIFAGISPDTKQPMYAASADSDFRMDFNLAVKYAKDLEVGDKKDFRIPSKAELNVLFQNSEKGALKGTFNLTGSCPDSYYWSSTRCDRVKPLMKWAQRFSDGALYGFPYNPLTYDDPSSYGDYSVRCVR